MGAILLYSVSSAVGQNFVYFTVTEFGPLILTTVTTVRKIFSTLYSVFRTPSNTLSPMQWGGCSMVFAGLLGDIVRKMMPKPGGGAADVLSKINLPREVQLLIASAGIFISFSFF